MHKSFFYALMELKHIELEIRVLGMKPNFLRHGRHAKLVTTSLCACLALTLAGCSDTGTDPGKTNLPTDMIKTGNNAVTEAGGAGKGATFFNNPRAIGEEPNGDLIVADFSSGHIVRINRETGDRQLLSDNNNPDQGPVFSQAAGVAILPLSLIHI